MNFLAICQRAARESLMGNQPGTVVGQSGDLARIVDWCADAYGDIQRRYLDEPAWRWLRSAFTFNTVSGTGAYAYSTAVDTNLVAAISRFNRWITHDEDGLPNITCYLQSGGVGGEGRLTYLEWSHFRRLYRMGSQNNGQPAHFTIDPQNQLVLGPTPADVYVITGEYQRGAQVLAADADVPEMPSDYHLLVVWWAIQKYGQSKVAAEIFNRGVMEGNRMMRQLEANQLPQVTWGGPLA